MRAYVACLAENASVIAQDEPANPDDVPESGTEGANVDEDDDVVSIDDVITFFHGQQQNEDEPPPPV